MRPADACFAALVLLAAAPFAQAQEAGARQPVVIIGGGLIRLEPALRLQIDSRDAFGMDPNGLGDALDIARKRVGVQGRVGTRVSFEVEAELVGATPWRDVYVNYRALDSVRLQAGQFKVPFSLDRSTSGAKLDFVNRSLAANVLAPRREQGVMVQGRLLGRALRYEAGMFRHDGERAFVEETDAALSGRTTAVRVTALPFAGSKSVLADLHAAVAVTHGSVGPGISRVRGQTALDERFLPYAYYWVAGTRWRNGLELRWRPGPFSVAGEYMRLTTGRQGQSVDGSDLSPLAGAGWYVSGTWVVTGEAKKKLDDGPSAPFLRGGIGAVELAARVEELEFGSRSRLGLASSDPRADHVAQRSDQAVTVGVNWLPHRLVKVQANLVRDAVAIEGGLSPHVTWGRVIRVQFSL